MKRKYIEENLELIGDDFLSDFTEALIAKDAEKTLKNLIFLREKSLDVRLFLEQLLFFVRDSMKEHLKKSDFGEYAQLFETFEGIYGRLKFSPDPFLLLETSTFRCIATHSIAPQISTISERKESKSSLEPGQKQEKKIISEVKVSENTVSPKTSENTATTFDFSRFVEHIRTVPKRSFVGLGLRVATYSEDGNTIVIHPDSDFNFKKLDTADVRLFLQDTLDTLF